MKKTILVSTLAVILVVTGGWFLMKRHSAPSISQTDSTQVSSKVETAQPQESAVQNPPALITFTDPNIPFTFEYPLQSDMVAASGDSQIHIDPTPQPGQKDVTATIFGTGVRDEYTVTFSEFDQSYLKDTYGQQITSANQYVQAEKKKIMIDNSSTSADKRFDEIAFTAGQPTNVKMGVLPALDFAYGGIPENGDSWSEEYTIAFANGKIYQALFEYSGPDPSDETTNAIQHMIDTFSLIGGSNQTDPSPDAQVQPRTSLVKDGSGYTYSVSGETLSVLKNGTQVSALTEDPTNPIDDSFQGPYFITNQDINFDGYADVAMITSQGMTDDSYDYYIFNPTTGQLDKDTYLTDVYNPVFDATKKQIVSTYRDGAGTYEQVLQFDGKYYDTQPPVLIR